MQQTATPLGGFYAHLKRYVFSGIGLIWFVVFVRMITLGLYPLYDPSEARYAEMGRKMLETGNWVTPMIEYGVPFWGKPPLTIWLTAISLDFGGVNDFAARFPSFLLGIGIGGLVFSLMRMQRGLQAAWASLLILGSCVQFFVMSGTVAMDQCLSFGITLAMVSFWFALQREERLWGYLFFTGLAIGILAKGPVTLVLTGLSLGGWTLLADRWHDVRRRLPWFSGTLLMLGICVPWYLIAERSTPGFLEYFFVGEHWKRFTESGWKGDRYGVGRQHVRGMIWLYWLGAGFPWSLVFLNGAIRALVRKDAWRPCLEDGGWRLYCLLWMLAPLVFFTFSANIIWTYVLPGLPGMALLLADCFGQLKKYRLLLALCVPVGFLTLVAVYQYPETDFFNSQKRLVEAYRQTAMPGERLVYLLDRPYSAQFYLQGQAMEFADLRLLEEKLLKGDHQFYIIAKNFVGKFPPIAKTNLLPVKSYGQYILYHAVTPK